MAGSCRVRLILDKVKSNCNLCLRHEGVIQPGSYQFRVSRLVLSSRVQSRSGHCPCPCVCVYVRIGGGGKVGVVPGGGVVWYPQGGGEGRGCEVPTSVGASRPCTLVPTGCCACASVPPTARRLRCNRRSSLTCLPHREVRLRPYATHLCDSSQQ